MQYNNIGEVIKVDTIEKINKVLKQYNGKDHFRYKIVIDSSGYLVCLQWTEPRRTNPNRIDAP